MSLGTIWTLIKALPELLALLNEIEKAAAQAEQDRKVKDDIKEIHQAFVEKDASRLNALFNRDAHVELPVGTGSGSAKAD